MWTIAMSNTTVFECFYWMEGGQINCLISFVTTKVLLRYSLCLLCDFTFISCDGRWQCFEEVLSEVDKKDELNVIIWS